MGFNPVGALVSFDLGKVHMYNVGTLPQFACLLDGTLSCTLMYSKIDVKFASGIKND